MRPGIRAKSAKPGQDGFALVLALLALMVLAGIASAAVAAAVGQLRAASMAGLVLAGRTAARGGIETTLRTTSGAPSSVVGGPVVQLASDSFGARGSWRVLDLRLSPEFHLFIGEGTKAGEVPIRDARVLWWLDPETRIAAHRAVVEADSVSVAAGARLLSDSLLAGRRGIPGCHGVALLDRVFERSRVPLSGGVPGPPEWGAGADAAEFANLRLGWYSGPMLDDLADHDLTEGVPPAPGCPSCWSGLVFGSGDVVWAASGAGVLAVNGNLTLSPGSLWTGLVLVAGNVVLEPASEVLGLVRGGGSVTIANGSVVDGSACAAFRALAAAASLIRPIPAAGRSWTGPVPPAGG